MTFFWKKPKTPSDASLQILTGIFEKGDTDEIERSLWQPRTTRISYLPITLEMILKLKRPEAFSERLSIFKTQSTKNFTLIIFNTPWTKNKLGYLPIIIENSTSKIVGVMLPFNELYQLLSKQQVKEISDLGMDWTMFAIEDHLS